MQNDFRTKSNYHWDKAGLVHWINLYNNSSRATFLVYGSKFHFGGFQRKLIWFPVVPVISCIGICFGSSFLVYSGNFHFCSLQRMEVFFKGEPVNSIIGICIGISKIHAIQIGIVAALKPPTSGTCFNAVPKSPNIVVLVLRAEHHVIMVVEAVPYAHDKILLALVTLLGNRWRT